MTASGTLALEPADVLTEMFGKPLMDTQKNVDVIWHDNVTIYLDIRGVFVCGDSFYFFGNHLPNGRLIDVSFLWVVIGYDKRTKQGLAVSGDEGELVNSSSLEIHPLGAIDMVALLLSPPPIRS